MHRRLRAVLLVVGTLGAGAAWASSISLDALDVSGFPIGAGDRLLLDGNGNLLNELSRTGIQITNLWNDSGQVSVELLQGPAAQKGDEVARGFVLLDNTLRVHSDIPIGEQRVRVRMGYRRADLRRLGLRAGSVRLMRRRVLGRRAARWLPAVQAATGRAGIRFARTSPLRVPGRVGNYGFEADQQFVWAIVDRNSDYAVGARLVPEPASVGLLGMGLLALFVGGRYRRDA